MKSTEENKKFLEEEIQRIFPNIPDDQMKIIVYNLNEFSYKVVAMELELRENNNILDNKFSWLFGENRFPGYDDPKVAKIFFKKLGITPRFHRTFLGNIWHRVIGIFFHDPFDNTSSHYIGKKVKDLMAWHSAINIFGNLIAALLSVDLGKNVVDAFLRQAGAAKGDNPWASIVASLGIYGTLTYFNEGSVRNPTYYEEKQLTAQHLLNIRPKRALGVKFFMIGVAALSGALNLSNASKSVLISREINDVIAKMERKADKADKTKNADIERLVELGKLRKQATLTDQDKARLSKLMKSMSENPPVPQAEKEAQIELDNHSEENRGYSQDYIENRKAYITALKSQQRDYENKGNSASAKSTEEEIKKMEQEIDDIEQSPYPLTPERKAVVRAKQDLAEAKDPLAFLNKYLVKVHGQEVGGAKIASIEKDIADRPLAEKLQIIWDENREALEDGRIPSLLANAILPIAIELITAATMLSLITSIRYRKLYTNEDFQSKYGTLVAVAQQYVSNQTKLYLSVYLSRPEKAQPEKAQPENEKKGYLFYEIIKIGEGQGAGSGEGQGAGSGEGQGAGSNETRMYSSQIVKEAIAQGFREESFPGVVALANWYLEYLKDKSEKNRARFWSSINPINIIKNNIKKIGKKDDKSKGENKKLVETEIPDTEQNGKSTEKNGDKDEK